MLTKLVWDHNLTSIGCWHKITSLILIGNQLVLEKYNHWFRNRMSVARMKRDTASPSPQCSDVMGVERDDKRRLLFHELDRVRT
jgi:hypothetical protein